MLGNKFGNETWSFDLKKAENEDNYKEEKKNGKSVYFVVKSL